MRFLWLALALTLPMTACGQNSQPRLGNPVNETIAAENAEPAKLIAIDQQEFTEAVKKLDKKDYAHAEVGCVGVAQQGGAVLCKTSPNQAVKIGRSETDFYYENANENGEIIIGFDRDEKRALIDLGVGEPIAYNFEDRNYDISRIDGLPPSQVSTFTDAQLARIRSASARKAEGFASRAERMGFRDGFAVPVKDYIKTTNFGAQRILNGEPKKPHMGVDMAAPLGTPIYAPADGIVSLADNDMYFEGALVMLDHGQGLISLYLHVNEILVEPGQAVKQGEQIATIGSKGRSTGPHLCWRLKWRNRNLDPELLTKWPAQN